MSQDGKASIAITRMNLTFGVANLETTGSINAGSVNFSQHDVDNIRLDGNTITTTDINGNLIVSANGLGVVDVQSPLRSSQKTPSQPSQMLHFPLIGKE